MTATQEEIAAAWSAWQSRHGGKLGPGPAFVEAINAALAIRLPTLESLQRENERLRAGLEPFALMAGNYDGIPPSKYHGDTDFQLHYPSDTKATLTIDYFRRARTALAST